MMKLAKYLSVVANLQEDGESHRLNDNMRWTTWEFPMSQNILTVPQWLAAELGLTTSPQRCFEISNALPLFNFLSSVLRTILAVLDADTLQIKTPT